MAKNRDCGILSQFSPFHGSLDADFLLADRMDEGDAPGVEGYAAVTIRSGCSIFQVAFDWTPDSRQLAAYLMVTAGKEFNFDQVVTVSIAKQPVAQLRDLRTVLLSVECETLVQLLVARNPMDQFAFRRIWPGTAESPVDFMDFSVTEHGVESFQALGRLGENCHSAYGTVQAVRNAYKDMTGLRIPLRYERLQRLAQRFVAGLVALDNLPHPFVKDKEVVVFKKNPARKVAGFRFTQFAVNHTANILKNYFTSS